MKAKLDNLSFKSLWANPAMFMREASLRLRETATKVANCVAPRGTVTRFVCTEILPAAANVITASGALYAGVRYAFLPFGHVCASILEGSKHPPSHDALSLHGMQDVGGAMVGVIGIGLTVTAGTLIGYSVYTAYSDCKNQYTDWQKREVAALETIEIKRNDN